MADLWVLGLGAETGFARLCWDGLTIANIALSICTI